MSDKMGMLAQMLGKGKGMEGEELDPTFKKAKMGVLKDLHKHMSGLIGDDMGGLKKVTVAAPSEEGLEMGLSKAKSMLPEMEEESSEIELEEKDPEEMSSEELAAKIEELQALQKQKQMKI